MEQDEARRILAIEAYQQKDFARAASYFNGIESPNEEDLFYRALPELYNRDFESAVFHFTSLNSGTGNYRQEINWFLGIAQLLRQNFTEAKMTLSRIQAGHWHYKESQKLLKSMPD